MAAPVDAAGKRRPYTATWRSAVLRSGLPVAAKVTLFALAEYADADGGSCFPSIVRVAQLAGVNERTARRSLDAAVNARLISRANRGGSSQGWRRYTYQLLIPDGAIAVASPADEGAGAMTARSVEGVGVLSARSVSVAGSRKARCVPCRQKVRAMTPEAAGFMSTDQVHDLIQHQEEAAHRSMRKRCAQVGQQEDCDPQVSTIAQRTDAWAMQHPPNGAAADRWPAWVEHTQETFAGTEAGMRRKLLAEARYLDTCSDPAAEIDAAIAQGDDCLTNDWMDEPAGRTHRGAGSEAVTKTELRTIAVFDGRSRDEAITDDFPDLSPMPWQLEEDSARTLSAAAVAYLTAKDGE